MAIYSLLCYMNAMYEAKESQSVILDSTQIMTP